MLIEDGVLNKIDSSDIINGTVVIPAGVTSINPKTFYGLKNLKSIEIPEGIEEIEEFTFGDCTNLESIKLPSTLKVIREKAFFHCEKLQTIDIPENVQTIESHAFSDCDSLKNVTLPDNLKLIDTKVFANCCSLENINIPKNLERISNYAFTNCYSLKKIDIPDSVEKIGIGAFMDCRSLTSAKLPSNLKSLAPGTFSRCDSLKSIYLPEGLKDIGPNCFEYCSDLQTVKIPDSVVYIFDRAFRSCVSLKNIVLPKNMKRLDSYVFDFCFNLKEVTLPENLLTIGKYAFNNCPNLENIVLPENVKTIEEYAFLNCSKLKTIKFSKNLAEIGISAFENCSNLRDFELPKSLKYIQESAFLNCASIENLNLPNGIEFIGPSAFSNCISLETANLESNLPFLSDNVFDHCISLSNVTLPKNITTIGQRCFYECVALTNIVLPESLLQIDNNAFEQAGLISVKIPNSVEVINRSAFLSCQKLKTVELPENLIKIDTCVFQNCPSLESVKIPNTVKTIGNYAFGSAKNLKNINLPNGLEEILGGAFYDCESLENVTIPDSVTKVSDYAFEKCNKIQSLHIPNNVRYLGYFRTPFAFFEKCDDGFIISQEQTPNSIPLSFMKINIPLISRHWDKRNMLFNEQKNRNICYFYDTFLINQSDEVIENFLDAHNFTFFKQLNIPDIPEQRYELFNFLYNIGAVSSPIEINGKKVDYAQKVVGLILEKERKGISHINNLKKMFVTMESDGLKPEFTEFFLKYFDDFVGIEVLLPGFAAWSYNEFENVQKANTSNRGSQRQLKPTVEKFFEFFMSNDFIGITDENKPIADAIAMYFKDQKTFDTALAIDKERQKNNVPNNILGFHLQENPFETIDELASKTTEIQANTLSNLVQTAHNEFTFEWLEKNDPKNFILGKLCTCCSHIEGGGYGIMRASIIDPNVQTLVIKNKDGEIIAKSTLYINPNERYGVFNNVEVNDNIKSEEYKKIFEKFMLGAKRFAEEYNKKFPHKKLKQLNVGMNLNDLSNEIQDNCSHSKILFKALDYSKYGVPNQLYNGDSDVDQCVVWKAEEDEMKVENTQSITEKI